MEDPRLSRMYLSLLARNLGQMWEGLGDWFSRNVHRLLWLAILILVTMVPLGWVAHTRGKFRRLKTQIREKMAQPEVAIPLPGGISPVVLQRNVIVGGNNPEFVSATLLPGRGMNLLQITAYVPGRGEVPLLVAPGLEEATAMLDGSGADANGGMSLKMGAAMEVPWGGRMHGTVAPDGAQIFTDWRGKSLALPLVASDPGVTGVAEGGLLLKAATADVKSTVMPDGGEAHATYVVDDFADRWPGKSEVTITILLSGRVVDIKVSARNIGTQPEPMGIGWHPRFSIPGGDRSKVFLRLPSGMRMETKETKGRAPTGRVVPVEGTPFDFTSRSGSHLGPGTLDELFVHLRPALLDLGPVTELWDPDTNLRLRMTAVSPTIRAMRVTAPAGENYIEIAPQSNYDDPFGKEWPKSEDTGMIVLQPGQTMQWRARLELFPLATQGGRL